MINHLFNSRFSVDIPECYKQQGDCLYDLYDMSALGWPDRIGYFCDEACRHLVQMTSFVSIPRIVVGDHVPIAAKYTIKVDTSRLC